MNRSRRQRTIAERTQIIKDRDAGKAFAEIQTTDPQGALPQATPQIGQDLDCLLFRQDEVNAQGQALAVDNRIGRRHAIKTRRAIFGFAGGPQALGLLALAIIRAVVKVHRDLYGATTPQLLRPIRGQRRIDLPFQARQIFDPQLLVEIAAYSFAIRSVRQFGTDRFNRAFLDADSDQDLIKRLAVAAIPVGFERQVLLQRGLSTPQDFRVIEFRLIIAAILFFIGLSFPLSVVQNK